SRASSASPTPSACTASLPAHSARRPSCRATRSCAAATREDPALVGRGTGIESRQIEQALGLSGDPFQDERVAVRARALLRAHQTAQTGAVDELQLSQIEHDPSGCRRLRPLELTLQDRSRGEVDLSAQDKVHAVGVPSGIDRKLCWLERHAERNLPANACADTPVGAVAAVLVRLRTSDADAVTV